MLSEPFRIRGIGIDERADTKEARLRELAERRRVIERGNGSAAHERDWGRRSKRGHFPTGPDSSSASLTEAIAAI